MRFLCSFLFTLTLSTFTQTKEAEAGIQHPLKRGLFVGGVTTLSVAGGGALGYLGGESLGGADAFESLGMGLLGGTITAAVAAPLGAMIISDYAGANKLVITRNTAIVSTLGAACAITGMFATNEVLFVAGLGTVFLASPLTAGISAGLVPSDDLYTLTPVITPEYRGFAFHSRF